MTLTAANRNVPRTTIIAADPYHVGDECYTVIAYLGNGRAAYHSGPKDYAYFTKEEATKLARRVANAGKIDLLHWHGYETAAEHWDNLAEEWEMAAYWERQGCL